MSVTLKKSKNYIGVLLFFTYKVSHENHPNGYTSVLRRGHVLTAPGSWDRMADEMRTEATDPVRVRKTYGQKKTNKFLRNSKWPQQPGSNCTAQNTQIIFLHGKKKVLL